MNIISDQKFGKRILFINPAKKDSFPISRIHMGLTLLGEILLRNGHDARVIDYAFLKSGYVKIPVPVPSLSDLIKDYKPDIIGISVFSYLYDEVNEMVAEIGRLTNAVLILGGPHFAVFPEDFTENPNVDYIVKGEAELYIADIVRNAKKNSRAEIIVCERPSAPDIPPLNINIAYGNTFLTDYQIQLSRGCPFHCGFCNIHMVGGRQVRKRSLEECMAEILEAKRLHPSISNISITDDCPNADKGRFKDFLRMFIKADTGCTMLVDNMRADLIDDEMLELFVKARGLNVCMGVESGNPDVLNTMNKSETIDDIIKAAEMIRKHKLMLGNCFVIGLPGDTPARHEESIALAKHLKPDYLFWNMCVPWKGTAIRKWYDENGHVGDLRNFSTLIDPYLNFKEPVCWTDDFNKEERIRAWLKANLETHDWFKPQGNLDRIEKLCMKYDLKDSLASYLRRVYPDSDKLK